MHDMAKAKVWLTRLLVFLAVWISMESRDGVAVDFNTIRNMLIDLGSQSPRSGWEPEVRNFLDVARDSIVDLNSVLQEHGTPDLFASAGDFFSLYYAERQLALTFDRTGTSYRLAREKVLTKSEYIGVVQGRRKMSQQRLDKETTTETCVPRDQWGMYIGPTLDLAANLEIPAGPRISIRAGPKGGTFRSEESRDASGKPCVRIVQVKGSIAIRRR